MHQFMKDNEYFNPIVEGYTLLGTTVKQGFYYTPTSKTKIYAGVAALWYDGDKSFNFIDPELSIQYNFNNHFSMIMGSLPSMQHHAITPMMLNSENFLTKPSEKGIEFLMDNKHLRWNTWISWEQFLHPYQHSQEYIYMGNSLEYIPIKTDNFSLSLPLQFSIYHHGGQINDVWMPLLLMYNNAVGINPKLYVNHSVISLAYYYLGYKDAASHQTQPFSNGDGHYISSMYASKHFNVSASYWQGYQFYAPEGEQIYSSVSQTIPLSTPSTDQKNRKLFIVEFYYNNQLAKNLHLLCGTEFYDDVINSILDYNLSLSLRYSGDLLLKNHHREHHSK
jgi:hypothetical protein